MIWLIWIGLAVAFGLVELLTLDLTLLMLAGGALTGCIASLLGVPWWAQILVACVAAILMIALLRPWALARLHARGEGEPVTGAQALVGQAGESLTPVTSEAGRIKLVGEVWTARTAPGAPPIETAQAVVVTMIEGATAIVAAAPEQH
ncbi:MAG: NfeD family protein [Micrococcales bacterium]|nr:NfeD family protein [Micrococcales bacterium]